jgi:hypothetical protein
MKKTGIMEAVNLLKEKKLLIEANINAAACDETIEYISYNSRGPCSSAKECTSKNSTLRKPLTREPYAMFQRK